jgi:hypothetical protein
VIGQVEEHQSAAFAVDQSRRTLPRRRPPGPPPRRRFGKSAASGKSSLFNARDRSTAVTRWLRRLRPDPLRRLPATCQGTAQRSARRGAVQLVLGRCVRLPAVLAGGASGHRRHHPGPGHEGRSGGRVRPDGRHALPRRSC